MHVNATGHVFVFTRNFIRFKMTDKNSEENLDCVHKLTELRLQENPGKITADMTEEALEGVKAAWLQEQNLIKVFFPI